MEGRISKNEVMEKVEDTLKSLYFVHWDRYIDAWLKEGVFIVYGWIDREKDSYKDFIILEFWKKYEGNPMYVTSSVAREKEIDKILNISYDPNDDCKRVEHLFPELSNAIKLK